MFSVDKVSKKLIVDDVSFNYGSLLIEDSPPFSEDKDSAFFVRRVYLKFSDQVGLSVIWGSGTYSSNSGFVASSFTETPGTVEAGIMINGHLFGEPLAYVDTSFFQDIVFLLRGLYIF